MPSFIWPNHPTFVNFLNVRGKITKSVLGAPYSFSIGLDRPASAHSSMPPREEFTDMASKGSRKTTMWSVLKGLWDSTFRQSNARNC